jgi:hypothetical protein
MKRILAVTIAALLLGSAALAQDTGGDKRKTAESKAVQKSQKTDAQAAGKKTSSTRAVPQANPFPTKKPSDKVALNPQPLPPGAKKASTSPESKVALNPQPLPPGAKKGPTSPESKVALNPQPLPPKAQTASQKKSTSTAKSGKKSPSPGTSSSTPK